MPKTWGSGHEGGIAITGFKGIVITFLWRTVTVAHLGRKRIPLRVIVKKAKIRSLPNDGEVVRLVNFGARLWFEPYAGNKVGDWIWVYEWYPLCKRREPTFDGWIHIDAIIDQPFEDYARLKFRNDSEENVPVSIRYGGKPYDVIAPGEEVKVIVKTGDFCLTEKGWTEFSKLQKCREVFDHESVITVFYHAMGQAYNDYQNDLKRVVRSKFRQRDTIEGTFKDIEQIDRWTNGSKYRPIFDSLYDDLGIDREWLKKRKEELLG